MLGTLAPRRARRALRRHAADPRRDDGVAAEHRLGAASTGSAWRCCSRCGRWGASSASAPACCSATRWRRSGRWPRAWVIVATLARRGGAGRLRAADVGFKAHRALFLRRARRGVRRVLRAGLGRHLGRAPRPAPAHAGAGAGHRQSRRAGRPDALGRAVARRRAVAARRRGAGGRFAGAASCRSGCRRSSPDYFVLDVPKDDYAAISALVAARGAGRGARGGADAARAARAPQRQAGRGDQGAARGAVGAQRRPRAVLCGRRAARLEGRRRRVVGRRTTTGEPLVSFEAELAEQARARRSATR